MLLALNWSLFSPMKRLLSTAILSVLISASVFAQYRTYNQINQPVGISSVNEAASISDEIVRAVGLKANFQISEAKVSNALAVLQNGRRYILYNPDFVNQLTRITGTKWAAVSVLAHEIGHHLYNTLAGKYSRGLASELEADKFSGYVLEKMGANLEEAQAAMNVLATPYATATHPAKTDRINSIESGWELAGGVAPVKTYKEETVTSPYIARLKFNSGQTLDYFIRDDLNIVSVENNQVSVVGYLNKSNDLNFPYIISVTDGYRLFISSGGQIVNSRGVVMGRLSKV